MKRLFAFVFALLGLGAMPAIAADAYTTTRLSLRAGPDSGYPRIRTLAPGTPLAVQGCIEDFLWCDVIAYGDRGWVAGDYLDFEYEGRRVYLPDYGLRIGIPIITFTFGSYWDSYYRTRPWYRQRDRWSHWRPVYRPPHRPRPPIQHRPPSRPKPPVAQPKPRPPVMRPPATRPPVQPRPPVQQPRPPVQRPPVQARPPVARPPAQSRPPAAPHPPTPARPAPAPARPAVRPAPRDGDRGKDKDKDKKS
jgi:uncharacterized protein YraI